MTPDQDAVAFADSVCGLVRPFPAQQDRMDREFAGRLLAYAPILEAARAAGLEDLARTVAPFAMVIDRAEIQISFAISNTRSSDTSIQVRMMNAGYQRRFAATQTVSHQLTISVQRSMLPPDGAGSILSGVVPPP